MERPGIGKLIGRDGVTGCGGVRAGADERDDGTDGWVVRVSLMRGVAFWVMVKEM